MSTPLGDANGVLIPVGTVATANGVSGKTAGTYTRNPENHAAVGVTLFVDVTAASGTSPTLTFTLQAWDPASQTWYNISPALPTTPIASTGLSVIQLYPGDVSDSAMQMAGGALPAAPWRVAYTVGGTTPSFTFSVGYAYTF